MPRQTEPGKPAKKDRWAELTGETALGRPGPLDFTPSDPTATPEPMDPTFAIFARMVFGPTGDEMVFQEQAARLFIMVGGSAADAERFRVALLGQDHSTLASLRPVFVNSAVSAGVARTFAETYWDRDILGLIR